VVAAFGKYFIGDEGNVFKTMDLTEHVEEVVEIGTSPLYSEDVGQVNILGNLLHQGVDQLWLRVWLCVV